MVRLQKHLKPCLGYLTLLTLSRAPFHTQTLFKEFNHIQNGMTLIYDNKFSLNTNA